MYKHYVLECSAVRNLGSIKYSKSNDSLIQNTDQPQKRPGYHLIVIQNVKEPNSVQQKITLDHPLWKSKVSDMRAQKKA